MKKKPFDLLNRLEDLPSLKPIESKNEVSLSRPKKVIASYSLNSVLVEKIERMSYWEHLGKSALVEAILEKYFIDKDFDKIPQRTVV
jgi:hypothetical protein